MQSFQGTRKRDNFKQLKKERKKGPGGKRQSNKVEISLLALLICIFEITLKLVNLNIAIGGCASNLCVKEIIPTMTSLYPLDTTFASIKEAIKLPR